VAHMISWEVSGREREYDVRTRAWSIESGR
jgi:hypothetical protein